MKVLTRRNGYWLSGIGIAIFLLNFITYTLWAIDIDILGATIFLLGIIMVISCGKSMKSSKKIFTRRNGVKMCMIVALIMIIFGYLPIPALNGDIAGFSGLILFVLGLILIAVRWNH